LDPHPASIVDGIAGLENVSIFNFDLFFVTRGDVQEIMPIDSMKLGR
jgi:hypothetical protein